MEEEERYIADRPFRKVENTKDSRIFFLYKILFLKIVDGPWQPQLWVGAALLRLLCRQHRPQVHSEPGIQD